MAYYAPFYQPTYYNPTPARQDMQYNQQFQQPMAQTAQPTATPNQNNPIIWVNGEVGAKSYLVAPGNTVMLLDAENPVFYLKSADASGMPMPLRIFDYKERSAIPSQSVSTPTSGENVNFDNFVTREEFEQRMASMASQCQCRNKGKKKEDVNDGESTV